jgi:diguanylate cyclase (GGDEF)-like protein
VTSVHLTDSNSAYNDAVSRPDLDLLRFFSPPDPALIQAGAGGERLVAWTRLGFWLFVGLAPSSGLVLQGLDAPPEILMSMVGIVVAVTYSVLVLMFLRNRQTRPNAGFLTGTIDVSILTTTLLAVALAGRAEIVLHSQTAWAVYILVIMTSCLRFDLRVCFYMGLLSLVEYCLLMAWIVARFSIEFSSYDLLIQLSRVMLLVAATALGMGIINRTRGLIRASGFDGLTGLANRAYFNERMRAELSRAKRLTQPLALVLFDIDHFKRFNDAHGHQAGDDALRRVADVVMAEKREQDFAARWGGEELALIVPDAETEGAIRVAKRIADRTRELDVGVKAGQATLTISAGVAVLGRDGSTGTELFAAADRRVYQAKKLGRDKIVCED